MTSIMEKAKAYVPPQTKNIADLEIVSKDVEILTKTRGKKGEEFDINIIVIDEVEYRVPPKVLSLLKNLIDKKIEFTHFRVIKSGEGKTGTSYQVIPLNPKETN